ncbi:hypothetical protein SAMN05216605_11853 [Pseudomonas abietaniphila]|uniref:Uncharacterized protein n=1 Tax=Pseudomonas abietaniphila TaxID=89065 RepID=A0A1G8P290_9PSED|nr:hypothetical protein SAMN05216605_11853 [Pseudomonas abietaniphila]
MRPQLRRVLLDIKVVFISSWRWLGERVNRRFVNVFLNIIRWTLIVYLSLFFYGFYSFGWLL